MNKNFKVKQGNTFLFEVPVLNKDGTSATLAAPIGFVGVSGLDFALEDDDPVLTKTNANGAVTFVKTTYNGEPDTWVMSVQFTEADTQALTAGSHYYEARMVDGNNVQTICDGIMTIEPTIVREA